MKTIKKYLFISLFIISSILSCTIFFFLINFSVINGFYSTMDTKMMSFLITIAGSLTYLFYLLMERSQE